MPGARPSAPDARPFAYAVGAVVLLGLVLRLVQLGTDSLWVDEINVVSFVRSGHLLTHLRNQRGPFESPLHPVVVWMALRLPIDFETAARVPAALFGTLEIFGLVMFTRRVTGRREVAILAGLLLAVAPFAVRYSQEVRYYTTFSALHVVTWWLVVRALQLRTRAAFVWWGVAVGVLLLAHPFAPVVVVAQLGVALAVLRRGRRGPQGTGAEARDLGVGVLVAAVVAAPWYLWGALRWIPDIVHGHSYALNTDVFPHVRLEPDLYGRIAQWLLGNAGRWTLLSVLLVLLALAAPLLARGPLRRVALGVLAYVVLFVALLVPLAWALHTYLAVRRIEFLVPPLVLLAAIGIHAVAVRVAELAARASAHRTGAAGCRRRHDDGPGRRAVAGRGPCLLPDAEDAVPGPRRGPAHGPTPRRRRGGADRPALAPPAHAVSRLARGPSPAPLHRGRPVAATHGGFRSRRVGHRIRSRCPRAHDPSAQRRDRDAGDRGGPHRAPRSSRGSCRRAGRGRRRRSTPSSQPSRGFRPCCHRRRRASRAGCSTVGDARRPGCVHCRDAGGW